MLACPFSFPNIAGTGDADRVRPADFVLLPSRGSGGRYLLWLLFRFFLLRKDSFDELPFSFRAFCSVLGSYSTLQDLQECPSHVVALHQQHLRCPRPSSACSSGTSSGAMETVVASRPTSTTSTTLPHRLHATCAIQGIQNVCMSMARQAIATRY